MNGMMSTVVFGLNKCSTNMDNNVHYGLGKCNWPCENGNKCSDMGKVNAPHKVSGSLAFSPSGSTADAVVEELDLILTSGRLNIHTASKIKAAFTAAGGGSDGLKKAQQLFLASTEFHISGMNVLTSQLRPSYAPPAGGARPFKAIPNR